MVSHRFTVRQLLMLLGFGLVAFLFRTWWQVRWVLGAGQVNLAAGDSQYHARLIENLSHHFPWRITVDPFLAFGDGIWVPVAPLLDSIVATTAWIVGGGSPSMQTVDTVTAFASPALAFLTVIVVGLLGARLFGTISGLFAAALLAIMPGQFLGHSLLGDPNHHVLEALLSALTILSLITALQYPTLKERLLRSALAGAVLGAYMLAWSGAALLVFIVCVWFAFLYVLHDLRGERIDASLAPCVMVVLILALVCVLAGYDKSFWRFGSQISALLASIVVVVGLESSRLLVNKRFIGKGILTIAIIVLVGAIVAVFFAVAPDVSRNVLIDLRRFSPTGAARSIAEVRPLLVESGRFSLYEPFITYGPALPLGLVGLALLIVHAFRKPESDTLLFTVWSAVLLIAMFCQNRFGYYAALPMALLTAWLCVRVWEKVVEWRRERTDTTRSMSSRMSALLFKIKSLVRPWMVELIVLVLIFVPSVMLATPVTKLSYGMPPEWQNALLWLHDKTPEPFAKPDYFLGYYRRENVDQPSYTIMNWWDYGYDIIRSAHRVPVTNPTQTNASIAASFFVSTNEALAEKVLEATQSRYIIVPRSLLEHRAQPYGSEGFFRALIAWAGVDHKRYIDVYMRRDKNGMPVPVPIYLPDYYRSMAVRLYRYGGKAISPRDSTYVLSYVDHPGENGLDYREIVDSQRFQTYQAALDYMRSASDAKHLVLAGLDPLKTAVPLDEITQIRMVYSPPERYPFARIFEYKAFK